MDSDMKVNAKVKTKATLYLASCSLMTACGSLVSLDDDIPAPPVPREARNCAYDYTVYGALEGEVTEVSADTLTDESGHRYYRIVVQTLPAKGLLADSVLLPGMTASADVVVGQRSVLSYFLSPLLRFSTRALREPH